VEEMNEEIKPENMHIHSRADELIACLEGEIAKRDARVVELESDLAGTQSRVLSLQDQWRKLDAELAALKAQYQRDVWGLNNEGDPIGGDPAGGYANDNARLRTELDAIKAQEPVWSASAEIAAFESFDYADRCFRLRREGQRYVYATTEKELELFRAGAKWGASLQPVSEAKAQGVVMPERDARTAYEAFYTEKTKTLPLPLGNAPVRYHNGSGQYVNDFALFGWMAWGAALDEVARLNAAPAQQVSVPDGYAIVPIAPTQEMIKAALDKPCFDPLGELLPWSHITRTSYAAMLAAAPAAPAADAWIPVSERLPDIAQEVIVHSEFDGVCAGVLDSYGEWFAPCSEYKLIRVTSWMPMPTKIEANRHD
jgi:hypothetical protein